MLSERLARGLADLLRILLSISDTPDVDAWARSLENGFRQVLGADTLGISLPSASGDVIYASPEARRSGIDHYMNERLPVLEREWGTKTRLLDLGVSSRRTLYADRLTEYYRSEMWNEFIVPNRFYDTVAMACRVAPGVNGFVFLTHGTKSGRRFGRSGLNGLRTLHPAFSAAVRSAHRVKQTNSSVVSMVDVLPTALALGDANGRLTHRNHALVNLLESEAQPAALVHAIDRMARRLAMSVRPAAAVVSLWQNGAQDTLQIGQARYRLSGSLLTARGTTPADSVMVVVERLGPPPFPEAALRARMLTAREINVARLIADGCTTERIASALVISIFTARHHIERVMQKLGVHSRGELTARLAHLAQEASAPIVRL